MMEEKRTDRNPPTLAALFQLPSPLPALRCNPPVDPGLQVAYQFGKLRETSLQIQPIGRRQAVWPVAAMPWISPPSAIRRVSARAISIRWAP